MKKIDYLSPQVELISLSLESSAILFASATDLDIENSNGEDISDIFK